MYAMTKDVKKRYPDLHKHFKQQEVILMAVFSQYFIALFLYDIPTNIGIRIFDVFLLEGERVLFNLLYKMLGLKRNKILELEAQDLFMYLRKRLIKECFEEYPISSLLASSNQEGNDTSEIE